MSNDGTERLAAQVLRARAQARATGRGVLVSVTEQVAVIDPFDALEALANAPELPASDRMYWTRPADAFAIAGAGSAATLEPAGAGRFALVDREWAAWMDDAIIDDPSGGIAGVGPTLMGGFAFDPDGPSTTRWRDFPSTLVTLPCLQITAAAEECWLTMNVMVAPDGSTNPSPSTILQMAARAMDMATEPRPAPKPSVDAIAFTDERPAAEWRALVATAVAAIHAGDLEKVVLAREVIAAAPRELDVNAMVRHLRAAHHGSYVFAIWHRDSVFIGASPERLVRLDGRDVHTSSLAGSIARGETPEEDAANVAALMASDKDREEHEVVRRTLRDALSEVCDQVSAADEPSLLSLAHVHHLFTPVHARLRVGQSLLQLVERLHPTPAVGGAPRDAALGFIRLHEQLDRGWYAAPIGWMQRGRGEFAVALRSALVRGDAASMFAGCGVVADSEPEREYAETLIKLTPMEAALAAALGHEATASAGAALEDTP